MDSGNSGSMSSSGGDDQDLDVIVSRPEESVSGFLNPSHNTMQFSDNNPNLFSQYQNQPTLFDLSSQYLKSLSQSQPTNQSLHHQPNIRSDHQQANSTANLPAGPSSSAQQSTPPISETVRGSYSSAKPSNLVRNSKKRTRASRRAPTTVLTTDTSNFRAMVQEFTGIPAPPFSAGASSYSRRLDTIFGSGSVYPLRPSAQKVHQSPFLSSTSSLLMMSNSVGMVNASSTSTSTSHDMNNFNFTHQGLIAKQLPPHHHHNNMMGNMQNPILSAFHHQEHQPPPFHSSTIRPLHSLEDQLGMSMSHGYLNTSLGASDGSSPMLPLRSDDEHSIVRWRDHGIGLGAVSDQNHHHLMRPTMDHHLGIVNSSSSNTRGTEATVESWVCPSE